MADKAVSLRGEQTVLFTNRQLVALMWPLLLEQFLAITVGLADSLMVATVGDAAISAVSLVDSISNLMIYIFSAMATGGAAVAVHRAEAERGRLPCRPAAHCAAGRGVGVLCGAAVSVSRAGPDGDVRPHRAGRHGGDEYLLFICNGVHSRHCAL